jgi:dynein light intermediate chain, axonemal
LYAQCFDEIIRQVTINCAERGLLLLRVRDEMRMTVSAYQTLYESAVAFGMRKALQTEQGKSEMEARMQVCCLTIDLSASPQKANYATA